MSAVSLGEFFMNAEQVRQLYLDLMKLCLTNSIYNGSEFESISMYRGIRPLFDWIFHKLNVELVRKAEPTNQQGKFWPLVAHTMIGRERLDNLQFCVETVLKDQIPGDLIETGVWRGGACIFMRAVLKAYGILDRRVYVADSFQGLPPPTLQIDKEDIAGTLFKAKQLSISIEQVQENFRAYDLYDDQVQFVKGWFCDTLPKLPAPSFSVIRLDGDLYQSTMDALINLYPKLSPGGFLIIDDYAINACRQAVFDYRQEHRITDKIMEIDWTGRYWRRSERRQTQNQKFQRSH
jgi:O-methyltransferase